MMTQSTLKASSNHSVSTEPIQLPTNCHNCPYFNNYHDNRGLGWCHQRNRHSFSHHLFTNDCELNLLHDQETLHSEFQYGDRVKIISASKPHSEWITYIVISKKYNPNPDEADWDYFLASPSQPTTGLFWVAENDLCDRSMSHNINPDGEF